MTKVNGKSHQPKHPTIDSTIGPTIDNEPLVELVEVSKHYADGDVLALDRVTLTIGRGEFVAVVGPSGCGKSTLLNMIGVLDRPTSGSIQFAGQAMDAAINLDQIRSKQIGFVFQSFHLLPNLTAEENVQLPMFGDERDLATRLRVARELLSEVGLADRSRHLPGQLSNGQRQRVAIARALANSPSMVLADEPTGALDSESGKKVMEMLFRFCRRDQTTLVVVTHDDSIADTADRIIRLRDGRVLQ